MDLSGPARILDGDTIEIGGTKMRLFGIDAPEGRQTGGREATQFLEAFIEGRLVRCVWSEIDRYGRPLATCYPRTKSGGSWSTVSLNKTMTRLGRAAAYLDYSNNFVPEMHTAMRNCRGMWSDLPHCWRRKQRAKR